MIDYSYVENLSNENILELYDDVIDTSDKLNYQIPCLCTCRDNSTLQMTCSNHNCLPAGTYQYASSGTYCDTWCKTRNSSGSSYYINGTCEHSFEIPCLCTCRDSSTLQMNCSNKQCLSQGITQSASSGTYCDTWCKARNSSGSTYYINGTCTRY